MFHTVTIKEATAGDKAFLFGLAPRLDSVPRPSWHTLDTMKVFQERFMASSLEEAAPVALTLIAVTVEDRALGYVHLIPGRDEVTDEACGHVAIIAVVEEAEGTGEACRLINEAQMWARRQGYRFLNLDVFADNKRAVHFYEREGFMAESIRMVKPLYAPVPGYAGCHRVPDLRSEFLAILCPLTEPNHGTEDLSTFPAVYMKPSLKLFSLGLIALVVLPVAVGSVYEVLSRHWAGVKYPPPGRLIDVGGRNVHLDCRGQGSPVVIFEAGLDSYGTLSWAKVHDSVARVTRACAYDRAGIMWSEPKSSPQHADAVAEDFQAVLINAGEKGPFVLVGHSIGGPYSMAYTRKFGDQVAGLVFVDASHPDQVTRFAEGANAPPDSTGRAMQIAASLAWTGIIRLMATADGAQDVPAHVTKKAKAFISTSLAAVVSENLNVDRSLEQAGSLRTLGDRPLVVLTAMAPLSNDALKAGNMSRYDDTRRREVWRKLHEDESSWTTRSRHQLLADSGHYIQFARPDVVVAAVLDVVNTVRLENIRVDDLR